MENLPRAASEKVFRAYKAYNPNAQLGVVSVLSAAPGSEIFDPETLVDILDNFPRGQILDVNPLGTDEALFEVIGSLTEQAADGLRMRHGLENTIKALAGSENAPAGAAMDLYMAKTLGYNRVSYLQHRIDVPGSSRWREADLIEECPAICGGLPGIQHENKNFLSPVFASEQDLTNPSLLNGVFQYSDVRLRGLGDEFARDLLIHQATGFEFYRLNFRAVNAGQLDIITQVLIKQFEAPAVLAQIPDAATREALRDTLLSKIGTVVSFHP